MSKIRDILRLKNETDLSLREIAKCVEVGKSTVGDIISRAEKASLSWPVEMNDVQLTAAIYPPTESKNEQIEPDFELVFKEMKKKHVTLLLLWEEYKTKHPEGIMYSQFCSKYQNFKKQNKLSLHKEHKAGEEIEVDWAGSTMEYINPLTGELVPVYIFVSVLPASSYPFAYAYHNQKEENWIDAHVRSFNYFGGVPRVTIPDNTKTAVTKADRFNPILNKSYQEMARHFGTVIVPARPRKPKDKAADEGMVGFFSRRIIAKLRDKKFFSIEEINQSISEELVVLINKPFQKREGNRQQAFNEIDKLALQPLPTKRYEYAKWKDSIVQFNYHVDYEGFFYSIHYSHTGKPCSIRATIKTIEIFSNSERIACHARNYNKSGRYITLPEHMPEAHKAVSGWSNDRLLSWAEKIGPYTKKVIQSVLESREYAVQTYRACMGILRYSNEYSNDVMEATSKEVFEKQTFSFKYFQITLKQLTRISVGKKEEKIVSNDNVRGILSFQGGGINV